MTLKKMLAYGYLYGSLNGLLGTIAFTLWKISRFIFINGFDVYLENWDYPREIVYAGVVISFFPAGVSGIVLASMLWRQFVNGTLTHRNAIIKGCLIGIIGILMVFGFVLITPLSSAIFRLSIGMQLIYLLVLFSIGLLVGGGTGFALARSALMKK